MKNFYFFRVILGSLYESLSEHWELTGAVKNYILGNPGPKLFLSRSGVSFRNGHAILDGRSGYLDAGDYQGECFSGKILRGSIVWQSIGRQEA